MGRNNKHWCEENHDLIEYYYDDESDLPREKQCPFCNYKEVIKEAVHDVIDSWKGLSIIDKNQLEQDLIKELEL